MRIKIRRRGRFWRGYCTSCGRDGWWEASTQEFALMWGRVHLGSIHGVDNPPTHGVRFS